MSSEFVVGIDASRSYREPMTGTERYSRRIIEHILEGEPDRLAYRLYFNDPPPDDAPLGNADVRTLPARRLWTHNRLSRELRRDPVDVLFVPSHVLPIYHPERSVVTVHDLGYLYEPDAHTAVSRLQLQLTTRWNARQATSLIAISNSTRQDLIDHLDVPEERITVIHHGVDEKFFVQARNEVERYRRAARLPERFILYLGTIQPRKNLVQLITAFEQLAAQDTDLHLILAGRIGWKSAPIRDRATASAVSQRIRLLGYVPDEQLPLLYSSASVLAIPSLYEGFGMPVLEAMACGTPVVMSNRGALPELAGADVEIADPTDPNAIANSLTSALARRNDANLIEERARHAARFSWESAAKRTRDVLWTSLNR